jgi:inactivated superfamily I helicase
MSEAEEGDEHDVELLESGEDLAIALEAAEQALDFIATFVQLGVVLPGFDPCAQWRHDWNEPEIQSQLPGLVAFVGAVHQQVQRTIGRAQAR